MKTSVFKLFIFKYIYAIHFQLFFQREQIISVHFANSFFFSLILSTSLSIEWKKIGKPSF